MYSWRYHPTLSLTKEPSLRNKSDAGVVPSSGIFCTSSMFFFFFLPGKVHVVHLLISFQSKGTLVVLKVQLCTINYCKSTVYSHFQVKDKYQRYKSTTVTKKKYNLVPFIFENVQSYHKEYICCTISMYFLYQNENIVHL